MAESLENSLRLDNLSAFQSSNFVNNFTDSNWLYHIFLSLFVSVLPTFLVIKVFGAIFAALLALYGYYWLTKHHGFLPGLFILFLFSTLPFITSINNLGAESLSLLIMLVGLELTVNYKYWQLGLISIVTTLLTGQFLFLLAVALLWLLIELIYNKYRLDMFSQGLSSIKDWVMRKLGFRNSISRRKWLVLIFCLFGILIGLVVNPYWPESTSFYKNQIMGNEINSLSGVIGGFVELILSAKILFIVFVITILSAIYLNKKLVKMSVFLLLLTLVLILNNVIFGGGINIVYLMVILSSSLILRDCFGNFGLWSVWNTHNINTNLIRMGIVVMFIVVLFLPIASYYKLSADNNKYPLDYMQGAAEWLYYHAPDGALVVNTNQEDWAPLFYYNSNNVYWWGLNDSVMNRAQKLTKDDFVSIVDGSSNKSPYALFKGSFRADYLLVNREREALSSRLEDNIYFSQVYSDEYCYVYKIQ